jgi:hypothetical protein
MTEPFKPPGVILGVDTHWDTPVGVVIDDKGKWLGLLLIQANLTG